MVNAGTCPIVTFDSKMISLIERYKLYRYDIFDKKKKNKKERGRTFQTHRVQKGDTLYSIAKRYNTTVEYIKSSNNLNSNALDIGQTLVIRSN